MDKWLWVSVCPIFSHDFLVPALHLVMAYYPCDNKKQVVDFFALDVVLSNTDSRPKYENSLTKMAMTVYSIIFPLFSFHKSAKNLISQSLEKENSPILLNDLTKAMSF